MCVLTCACWSAYVYFCNSYACYNVIHCWNGNRNNMRVLRRCCRQYYNAYHRYTSFPSAAGACYSSSRNTWRKPCKYTYSNWNNKLDILRKACKKPYYEDKESSIYKFMPNDRLQRFSYTFNPCTS